MKLKAPKFNFKKARPSPKADVQTTCAACNSAIAPDATFCEACHAPVVRRYCPKCSRLVPENSKICPYCGTSSKVKPRESTGLSNIAILAILGMGIAFFLMGGFFPSQDETKKIEPPPPVQLAENKGQKVNAAHLTVSQRADQPVQVSGNQPIVRSDEEGTRLNLQAYDLIQQRNYHQAEPILRRAVQSFPAGTTAVAYKYSLYNLGHVLRRNGKPKEAIPFLEQVVKLDPAWTKAQSELAVAKETAQSTEAL